MKKWIARKLFDLAAWLDWEEAVSGSYAVVFAEMIMDGELESLPDVAPKAPPKKRGRPIGRKDSVGKVLPPKKVGRPLGSKDKQPRKRKVTPA